MATASSHQKNGPAEDNVTLNLDLGVHPMISAGSENSDNSTLRGESDLPNCDRATFGTRKIDQASEHWSRRFRVVIFSYDQAKLAKWIFLCLVGISGYFLFQTYINDGLVDIDQATALRADFKIDINRADLGEIIVLPGVGEKLAFSIISYRQQHGPFESFDAISEVPGIGPKKLQKIIPFLLPLSF